MIGDRAAARRPRPPAPLELRRRLLAGSSPDAHDDRTAERQAIASFSDYALVEQAMDLLVAREFPVEHVSISGEGLRLVEDVTGRLTYGVTTLRGLVAGALFGVVLGMVFGFVGLTDPIVSGFVVAAWGALAGAAGGALVASLGRWLEEGRRDFVSRTRLEATRQIILCDVEHAEEAARVLAPMTDAFERKGPPPPVRERPADRPVSRQ